MTLQKLLFDFPKKSVQFIKSSWRWSNPYVCSATAVHTLRRIIFPRKRSASKSA